MIATALPAALQGKRGGWRWIGVVVAMLGGHVTLMMWAVVKATGDPNFVVIPNYYEKAVNWDKEQARRQASARLGWELSLEAAPQSDALHRRRITFRLTDSAGEPVPAAWIRLNGFHDADARHPFQATIPARSPGVFIADLPMRAGGFYDFSVEAEVDDRHFIHEWRQYVSAAETGGMP